MTTDPYNVTQALAAIRSDDPHAGDALLKLVYDELRTLAAAKMRHERPGNSLQATALVHEAWLRIVDDEGKALFENRAHFFSAAAEAMRRILIDRSRRRQAGIHGGGIEHCNVDEIEIAAPMQNDDELLQVHEALDKLAEEYPRKAEVVKLRFFVGLHIDECAKVLGISEATAKRDWTYARAWLYREIQLGKR